MRARCFYTPHAFVTLDPDLGRAARLVYGGVERLLSLLGDRIVCVSDYEREHAIALGIPARKLCVIHNGVGALPAAERPAVRAELGLSESDVCVGTVGRISHQKAMDRLVRAFAEAHRDAPRLRLVIVGDGEERARVDALVDDMGVRDRVTFTGRADGVRTMAAFDLFALTSRYEACPYVLLEAAARSLPVVMMATGGAGSIVRDGDNGVVVEQGDIGAFATALARLAGDDEQRSRMGAASLRSAQRYSVDHMVEQTLEAYAGSQ